MFRLYNIITILYILYNPFFCRLFFFKFESKTTISLPCVVCTSFRDLDLLPRKWSKTKFPNIQLRNNPPTEQNIERLYTKAFLLRFDFPIPLKVQQKKNTIIQTRNNCQWNIQRTPAQIIRRRISVTYPNNHKKQNSTIP